MARPKDEPLIRLSRQFWVRALRRDFNASSVNQGVLEDISWAELGRQLLRFSEHPKYADFSFKGLLGVVNDGNDPHKIIRRIDVQATDGTISDDLNVVTRQPSGPATACNADPIRYIQFPVDLVECGKELCPGSEQWGSAYLWRLATPQLPRLEELRLIISILTNRLGMHSPSVDEYRPYLSTEEFSALDALTDAQAESQYRQSLEPFITAKSADAISLLAALVAESFVTDQELMMYIHRDAFRQACECLFSDEHFKDIEHDFYKMVAGRVLDMNWQMPPAYHISSISSPFISMDRWKEITGNDKWTPIWGP